MAQVLCLYHMEQPEKATRQRRIGDGDDRELPQTASLYLL